jgi:hypothetical protein
MMLTLQELASKGREADPMYGKKKGEKMQAFVNAVNKLIGENRDGTLREVGVSAMTALLPKVRSAATAVAAAVEKGGLSKPEQESLAESVGVNKASYRKLSAADKVTYVVEIIPLLETIVLTSLRTPTRRCSPRRSPRRGNWPRMRNVWRAIGALSRASAAKHLLAFGERRWLHRRVRRRW